MNQDLTEIINFLKNKTICLIGNAESILKNTKDIDKFEVICRMNRGFPRTKEKYIGSRTDILFLSCRVSQKAIEFDFNPKYVIWMTTKNHLTTDFIDKVAFQYNPKDWDILRSKLPKRPTTGCMALDFLLKYIEFKKLTIYGCDFFETGTWYHKIGCHIAHDAKSEEKLILNMIKDRKNVELIIE